MARNFILVYEDSCGGTSIEGIFSTEEKAKAVREYFIYRNGPLGNYVIKEEEVDSTVEYCIRQVMEEINEQNKLLYLLNKLKEVSG